MMIPIYTYNISRGGKEPESHAKSAAGTSKGRTGRLYKKVSAEIHGRRSDGTFRKASAWAYGKESAESGRKEGALYPLLPSLLLFLILAASCSTTKHIPEGEQLYTGQRGMIIHNLSHLSRRDGHRRGGGSSGSSPQQRFPWEFHHALAYPLRALDLQCLWA